eukprot:scaffold87029_cov26-Tisochrysis_lutea.AAC.4
MAIHGWRHAPALVGRLLTCEVSRRDRFAHPHRTIEKVGIGWSAGRHERRHGVGQLLRNRIHQTLVRHINIDDRQRHVCRHLSFAGRCGASAWGGRKVGCGILGWYVSCKPWVSSLHMGREEGIGLEELETQGALCRAITGRWAVMAK